MTNRERADRLLVARGLFESRARAQAAIAAGLVTADGVAGTQGLRRDLVHRRHRRRTRAPLRVAWRRKACSRTRSIFRSTSRGRVCLDVGASTGGFAEVLLTRGARRVYAVDVGSGQLHHRLHGRDDILSLEQTDIRTLDPDRLPEQPDLATIDVSFISLKLVLPAVGKLLAPRAQILALIKPQFEADRRHGKKGIIRDEAVHKMICEDIGAFTASLGWRVGGVVPSAILGGDGNREFFIEANRG